MLLHGKNNFAEVSKNLVRYRSENKSVKLSNYYNYVANSSMMSNTESFDILATRFFTFYVL